MDALTAVQATGRGEVAEGRGLGTAAAIDEIPTETASERDMVCLDRRELHDLLRRVRGLERLIGRVLGRTAVAYEPDHSVGPKTYDPITT